MMVKIGEIQGHLNAIDGVIVRCANLELDLQKSHNLEIDLRKKNNQLIRQIENKSQVPNQTPIVPNEEVLNQPQTHQKENFLNRSLQDSDQQRKIQLEKIRSKIEALAETKAKFQVNEPLSKAKTSEIFEKFENVKENLYITTPGIHWGMEGENKKLEELVSNSKQNFKDVETRNQMLQACTLKKLVDMRAKLKMKEGELSKLRASLKKIRAELKARDSSHRKSLRLLGEKIDAEKAERRANSAPVKVPINGYSLSMLKINSSTVWAAKIHDLENQLNNSNKQLKLAHDRMGQFELETSRLKKRNKSLRAAVQLQKIKNESTQYRHKKTHEATTKALNEAKEKLEERQDMELWQKESTQSSTQFKRLKASAKRKDNIIMSLKSQMSKLQGGEEIGSISQSHLRILREQLKKKEKSITDLLEKLKVRISDDEKTNSKINLMIEQMKQKDNVIINFNKTLETLGSKLVEKPNLHMKKIGKLEAKCIKFKSELLKKDTVADLTKNQVVVLTKKVEEIMLHSKEWVQKLHQKTKEEMQTRESLTKMFETLRLFAKDLSRTNRLLRKESTRKGVNIISRIAITTNPPVYSTLTKDALRTSKSSKNLGAYVEKEEHNFVTPKCRPSFASVTVPRVVRPANTNKDGTALCHYISTLVEERIGLELAKMLQRKRRASFSYSIPR